MIVPPAVATVRQRFTVFVQSPVGGGGAGTMRASRREVRQLPEPCLPRCCARKNVSLSFLYI